MAEAPDTRRTDPIPAGLLEELSSGPTEAIRPRAVARARRQAITRAFDNESVYEEIASQLLHLSSR